MNSSPIYLSFHNCWQKGFEGCPSPKSISSGLRDTFLIACTKWNYNPRHTNDPDQIFKALWAVTAGYIAYLVLRGRKSSSVPILVSESETKWGECLKDTYESPFSLHFCSSQSRNAVKVRTSYYLCSGPVKTTAMLQRLIVERRCRMKQITC